MFIHRLFMSGFRIVLVGILFGVALPALCQPAPLLQAQEAEPDDAQESTGQLLFSDAFDVTGDLSLWSGDKQLTVEEGIGYGGGYAARAHSDGAPAYAQTRLDAPTSDVFVRIRFKVTERGAHPISLLRFRTVPGESILTLIVTETGTLAYQVDVSGIEIESVSVPKDNEWHEVQVQVHVAGNASQVKVWLDETEVSDLGQTLGLGSNTVGRIELGDNSSGRSFDVLFDDVIADERFVEPTQLPDPVSGTLVIQARPALPGLQFILDGATYVTNEFGVVSISVESWTIDLRRQIEVPATPLGDDPSAAVATFSGWDGWTGVRDRSVNALFDMSYPVSFKFEDRRGVAVEPSQIVSVMIKSDGRDTYTFNSTDLSRPQLLPGSRMDPTRQGLETKQIRYSVVQVMMKGSKETSAVIRSKQDFTFSSATEISIKLLLFSVTISARDALFGRTAGTAVEIEFEDGTTISKPFDSNQEVTFHSLPRGEYQVTVIGGGYSPPRPLTLSRDQTVTLEVVTMLDMAVVGGLVASFGFGLLFAGRPGLLTFPFRILRRRRVAKALPEVSR